MCCVYDEALRLRPLFSNRGDVFVVCHFKASSSPATHRYNPLTLTYKQKIALQALKRNLTRFFNMWQFVVFSTVESLYQLQPPAI